MIKLLASYNEKVADVVLKNAPLTAKYTSPQIQREILYVLANKVRKHIRKDIGDSKFCIIVDEARDESKREQMALVLRFVDKDGFIKERFFYLYHVQDTSSLTLKNAISEILSHHCLDIQNIRGQGYDGASNMRGEWNGLQALFLNECPCAYYVHCFAHRLQLALIAASKEVSSFYQFFQNLNFIINIITASSKRHDQFQAAQNFEFEHLQAIGELKTGTGSNQVGTLKRASDTRWGSHFYSICSLQRGYNESCSILEKIRSEGSNYSQRGDATAAYKMIISFEFIFNLILMKEIMGITEILCQALQQKSQDILNAMQLVSSTKELIQDLRNDGWKRILESVVNFSNLHEIDVPHLDAQYIEGRGRRQHDQITIEHHYHFDIFNSTIDFQLQELDRRFTEQTMELLSLSSSLDPKNGYKAFNVDDICSLAEKYYSLDFSEQEKINLNCQLKHFHKDIPKHPKFQNLSSMSELCQGLAETGKSNSYHLVDRLIRLILTLPVSTASGERAFSAMKIVKTRLRNKMEDDFLANNLVVYIEREIAETFTTDSILEDFVSLKERRSQFRTLLGSLLIMLRKESEIFLFGMLTGKRVIIPNKHGQKLVGILHECGTTDIVILCHGFRCSKDTNLLLNLAVALENAKISSFRFDFSGNGESEGSFQYGNYWTEVNDLHAVAQHFRESNRVITAIVGHSKGGDVVLLYASKYHDIKTVVNLSGRYDLKAGIEERLGKDYLERIRKDSFIDVKKRSGSFDFRVTEESLMDRLGTNMHEACLQIDKECRVLTIHGSSDQIIPVEDALEFAKIIPNHKLHIIEGADHAFNNHQDELSSVVVNFIKETLH